MNTAKRGIKDWAKDDRPREKLLLSGSQHLSLSELLAILIHSGTKDKTAVEVAKDILHLAKNNLQELGKLSVKQLMKVKGIGEARAITIVAALELGRRRADLTKNEKFIVTSSDDIAHYLRTRLKDIQKEQFIVVFLNRANRINHIEVISEGGMTGTVVDPRLILKKALEENAVSLILSHNHPSGNLQPSKADKELTEKIKLAASYMDIQVLDHIIVSEDGYFSFADDGLL